MKHRPRFDLIYLLVVIAVIYLLAQFDNLTTESLIIHLVFFDVVVGFILIIKGLVKWDMSYIFTGAFCALSSYYSYKDISDTSLLLLILSGLVGVGNHVRNGFKNTVG